MSYTTTKRSQQLAALFLAGLLMVNDAFSLANALERLSVGQSDFQHLSVLPVSVNEEERIIETEGVESVETVTSVNAVSRTNSGPGQAETSGFSIGSTDGLVDKFTGDFSYSLPLMDVEGYPIVLNYNSNVLMNSEASWVGLGWDLNVGAISREMRGIPDEFNGEDEIERTINQKEQKTENAHKAGGYMGASYSFPKAGGPLFTPSLQVTALWGSYYNTYLGKGKTFDFGLQTQFTVSGRAEDAKGNELQSEGGLFGAGKFSFGYSRDTKAGKTTNSSVGISGGYSPKSDNQHLGGELGGTFGRSFNSRGGLQDKSFGLSAGFNYSRYGAGYENSASLSYGTPTSIPRVMFNSKSDLYQVNYTGFFGVNGGAFSFRVGGIYQTNGGGSKILTVANKVYEPAYGFLHSGKRYFADGVNKLPVMDFQRSTEYSYSTEMKDLPFSVQTYDVFHVNAMGLGATFRAGRTDFGTYFDPVVTSQTNGDGGFPDDVQSYSAGVVVGNGIKIIVAPGFGAMNGEVQSGNWDLNSAYSFNSVLPGDEFDPTTYFKSVGELTPNDMTAWDAAFGTDKAYFRLEKDGKKDINLTNTLASPSTSTTNPSYNNVNQKPVRATYFNPLIASSLAGNSLYQEFAYLTEGSITQNVVAVNRQDTYHKDNHISAIEVWSVDGTKYTYGIPVYNLSNSEVMFSSGDIANNGNPLTYDPDKGTVAYTAGVDNSVNNQRGLSNYYDKTTMPSYAHSFLLTRMTSSDYVDRTFNGPSLDDIGSYYQFNYRRVYDATTPYTWRFPVSGVSGSPIALQNRGILGTFQDDMANYTYGEKEIWYTHSIESRNQIAFIYLKDRKDAYAADENGLLNSTKPLKCIDKIVLYNLSEYTANPATAVPIQTVEFEYDYSLCPGAPSNLYTYNGGGQTGKLTLKKIRVYNGKSKEAGLQVYSFEYSTENPAFNYGHVDGWGNNKQNIAGKPNDLFPYVDQTNVSIANQNSKAWKLVAINNPLGGRTEVDYEADRYKYVQDERAMRHFDIKGMTSLFEFLILQDQGSWNGSNFLHSEFRNSSLTESGLHSLFTSNGYSWGGLQSFVYSIFNYLQGGFMKYFTKFGIYRPGFIPNNVMVFELEDPLSSSLGKSVADKYIKDKYFKSADSTYLKELYVKLMVNVKTNVQTFVPAFADISEDYVNPFEGLLPFEDDFKGIGVMPADANGDYKYGYVILNPVNTGHIEVPKTDGEGDNGLMMHPLQYASLDYSRQNLSDKIYGTCENCESDLTIDKKAIWGRDIYRYMIDQGGYVSSIIPSSSVMRMFEPDNVKYGGNGRVKQIAYLDNWSSISGEYSSVYRWNYYYSERSKETGVASFESGGIFDENPLYGWDTYIDYAKRFPDETRFHVKPLASVLYPVPVVGYEDVRVYFSSSKPLGYSQTSFYTAKDKPTTENVGLIQKVDAESKLGLVKAFTGKSYSFYGFSQGYEVETNNFHGQIKQALLFNGSNELQARTTYNYYGLGEKVPMLDRKGNLGYETVSTEYDMHVDSRMILDETNFHMGGVSLSFTWSLPPRIGVMPFYTQKKRESGFYSNCFIKHINRSAVLKSVKTEYLGSANTAEDLIYDRYSGAVILSGLKDEFEDILYSFNYPAHWYYKGLRNRSETQYLSLQGVIGGYGFFTPSASGIDLTEYFTNGDMLSVVSSSTVTFAYVLDVQSDHLNLINPDGSYFNGANQNYTIAILSPGRDNRLGEVIQSVVTKKKLNITAGAFEFPVQEIISAGVLTYKDKNSLRCRVGDGNPEGTTNEVTSGATINPYLYGVRGDLVPDGQYNWQSNRVNNSHAHGIRFDGAYTSYIPYYRLNSADHKWYMLSESGHPDYSSYVLSSYPKWRKMGEVKEYDEYGQPLYGVDQIKVPSAVLYGYNASLSLLPVAQAVNARNQDIAYDGFEDYTYFSNVSNPFISESHFDFKNNVLNGSCQLSVTERHSGLRSLAIPAGVTAAVTKTIDPGVCGEVSGTVSIDKSGAYIVDSCHCISPFHPAAGKYIVGAWLKQDAAHPVQIQVTFAGGTSVPPQVFTSSGSVLDGWQRLEGTFTIPSDCQTITVSVINAGRSEVYLDDFRIHPFLAGMTTVVYDPKTLLPLATHDGYNFTTYYNYDENLNLVRVRVETEKGIQTVSESEAGGQKNYKN